MASLRLRNGKWQVQVRRHGHSTRAQSFQSKSDAQRWARQIEAELDRTLIPNDVRTLNTTTVAQVLTRYRDTVTNEKRGLVPERKRIEVFLRQRWSTLPLAKIDAALFSRYRDARLKQVRPGTVIRELGLLRSIFEMVRREWGYATFQNPLAALRKPKTPEGRDRRLRAGELQALTQACSVVNGTWLLHGFHLAIETGLRRGELLGIRWQDVNFDTAVLYVPFTKTDKARTIPLTDRAVDILKERKAASTTDAEYAFPVGANAFRLAWERCKRRAERAGSFGVRELRFHDLRHEAISRFFELGLNTAEVASISGHRDLRMLFRYTHLTPEYLGAKLRANKSAPGTERDDKSAQSPRKPKGKQPEARNDLDPMPVNADRLIGGPKHASAHVKGSSRRTAHQLPAAPRHCKASPLLLPKRQSQTIHGREPVVDTKRAFRREAKQ
ncbi:integrase [Bradyrhizobium sp. USDA 4341]